MTGMYETLPIILLGIAQFCLSIAIIRQQKKLAPLWEFYENLREIATEIGDKTKENRCPICAERSGCPAYETGVAYPCPYYEEKDDD